MTEKNGYTNGTGEKTQTLQDAISECPPTSDNDAPSNTNISNVQPILEAVLYAANDPIKASDLSSILPADGHEIRREIKALKQEYNRNDRGFQIIKVAGGFKMTTREEHYEYLKKIFGKRTLTRISDAAIETLVIIAYHQPITRNEAESVRGVNCQSVLETLLEKDFIKISGRRDEIGKPIEYSTTDKFLDYFNLNTLNDLPDEDEIESILNDQ